MSTPIDVITAAEATGRYRYAGFPLAGSTFLPYTAAIPIATSTTASPRLNATSRIKPNPIRPSATELNNSTSADGQGTNPPLAPSATRLPALASPPVQPCRCHIPRPFRAARKRSTKSAAPTHTMAIPETAPKRG